MQSRLLLASLFIALATSGCGGGGGGAPAGGPAPAATVATPNLDTNVTAALFENEGVYFFGGAGSSVNGVDQTYIRKVGNGSTEAYTLETTLVTSRHAGADSLLTNGLFDALPRQTLMWEAGNASTPAARVIYNSNNFTGFAGQGWMLDTLQADLAGTSLNAYLLQARNGQNAPTVAGNFSSGARSVRLRYSASQNIIAWPASYLQDVKAEGTTTRLSDVSQLPTAVCFHKTGAGNSLRVRIKADGNVDFHLYAASGTCSGALPAATASSTWLLKTMSNRNYIDFAFPAGIAISDYDDTFTPTEFASGIRFVLAKPYVADGYYMAYFFAPGAAFADPVLHMNRQAADDLKAALALP